MSIMARTDDVHQQPEGLKTRLAAFMCKVRSSMSIMKKDFEHEGDGSRSRERSAERLRDEEAWSQMDGEGCPNVSQAYARQDPINHSDKAASAPVVR